VPDAQGQTPAANNFVTGFAGYPVWLNTYYPNYQLTDLKFTVPGFNNAMLTSAYLSAENPDLRGFAAHGGKLLLYHGWDDQHISPQGTLKYWETLNEVMGEDLVTRFASFYLFPGMAHCGGGMGPNQFDILTPLMSWVELGAKPNEIVASLFDTDNNLTRTRPVFPYPTVARYLGAGSTDVAANFGAFMPKHEPNVSLSFIGNYLFAPGYPQEKCHAEGAKLVCVKYDY
jgi:feruloyl esterase